MFRSTALAALLALALPACAAVDLGNLTAPSPRAEDLASFTVVDLQNADKDAVAHGDQIAHACYPALERFIVELHSGDENLTVSGAFGAFQRARDIAHRVDNGLPDYVVIGCAPLFVDSQVLLAKIALVAR